MDLSEFEASLVYRTRSSKARNVTQRNPVLKNWRGKKSNSGCQPIKKKKSRVWRDGSAVKSTDSRGPGFNSQYPNGGSQLSVTPRSDTITKTYI